MNLSIESAEAPFFRMDATPDVAAELKPTIERALARVRHLAPAWCEYIVVKFITNPQNEHDCEIECDPHYRHALLSVMPRWFDLTPDERHHSLVHELAHLPTMPVAHLLFDLCDRLIEDENLRALFREQARRTIEAATEDITNILRRCGV